MEYDIIIVGGSLGGVRAAISAAKESKKVLMCERTDWVGGQLTSQAVPPDEHKWIESQGAPLSYLNFRKKVRDYYRNLDNTTEEIKNKEFFSPGGCWVSRIGHSPKVAHDILMDDLKPYTSSGLITILYNTVLSSAKVEDNFVKSVVLKNLITNEEKEYEAKYFLDATDCGDLLPLTNTEYRMGRDSKAETGEPNASDGKDPLDMQPVTWVFALELKEKLEDKDYIKKPENYDYWKAKKTHYLDLDLFSWYSVDIHGLKLIEHSMFDDEIKKGNKGLWSYRRIVDKTHYTNKVNEISLINWPQNDYDEHPVYGVPNALEYRMKAKEQSLCFAYYLQNEAPNRKGGFGYPVALCGEVLGTEDGLAKDVYIRESRRIVGIETIVEQDVSKKYNTGIKEYRNSVGVGHYSIDIHQTVVTHSAFFSPTYPFEIPLGAMIPIKTKNLIPSCKNISTTHYTNGCYRLHPVEWNIGEVAGLLASFAIDNNYSLKEINEKHYEEFKELIEKYGVQTHWRKDEMNLDGEYYV